LSEEAAVMISRTRLIWITARGCLIGRLSVVLVVVGLAMTACSDSGANDGSRALTVAMESSELESWEATAVAFFDRTYEDWPDLEAKFSEYGDDAVFYDPTFGDYWVGPEAIIAGWRMMPSFFPELEGQAKSVFLSADGAVFSVDWVGFWIGKKPSDVPWPAGLEVFRFDGDAVASQDLWYTGGTLEGEVNSCGGCSAELDAMADRYAAAWSSGNTDQIAALYSDGAALSDSMFGIAVVGADEIGMSITERFGSAQATMRIQEVFGVTLDSLLIPLGSPSKRGDIAGVGIRYQWTIDGGGNPTTVDSLALVYLGSVLGGFFESDPQNLIVREEIFHNPDTLASLTP
jgi:ketosteroid isomerase-like protein